MKLCGAPTDVHGAEPCPREAGHNGDCYWWIPFELGCSRVTVYSGAAPERRRVCCGAFICEPSAQDVHNLLVVVGHRRRLELERRARA